MNVLAELQKRAKSLANAANFANPSPSEALNSQDSRDSQGVIPIHVFSPLRKMRARLLALSAAIHVESVHVHRLHDDDMRACDGFGDAELSAYLLLIGEASEQKARGSMQTPTVECGVCRHFKPDSINPATGLGYCGAGKGAQYPMKLHWCALASAKH